MNGECTLDWLALISVTPAVFSSFLKHAYRAAARRVSCAPTSCWSTVAAASSAVR